MYYQVVIETAEQVKVGKTNKNRQYFELDKTDLSEIEERVVKPYLRKEEFQFDGYFLKYNSIRRIAIKATEKTATELADSETKKMLSNGIFGIISASRIVEYDSFTKDITTTVFDKVKSESVISTTKNMEIKTPQDIHWSKVFIVHGRDELAKVEVARFIDKLGLSAIILHEQASSGKTIIEKIEEHTNVGFAIILYTPCDVGGLDDKTLKSRARQNVVFEHGYLIGKLGREKVCALVKGDLETPGDMSGIVYIPLDSYGAWHMQIAKELKKAGLNFDAHKIIE